MNSQSKRSKTLRHIASTLSPSRNPAQQEKADGDQDASDASTEALASEASPPESGRFTTPVDQTLKTPDTEFAENVVKGKPSTTADAGEAPAAAEPAAVTPQAEPQIIPEAPESLVDRLFPRYSRQELQDMEIEHAKIEMGLPD